MKKIYKPQTFLSVILNSKNEDKKPLFFNTLLTDFMINSYVILLFVFLLFTGNNIYSQVSYLGLDGGLEGTATIDNTAQTAPAAGVWRKANATQTIANETTTVRSGSNSLRINNTDASNARRVWSPNFTVSSTTSSVTVQFWRRSSSTTNTQTNQQGIINNTEGLSGTYSPVTAANTWEKVTYTKTSSTWTTIAGIVMHKQLGTGGTMYIDDMAVYTGAVDNTAPNDATAAATANPTNNSLDVSWTAASGGVDGGGYIVVRGLADPTTAPNVNGIYAVNNLVAAGMTVVYSGTGTSFTDGSLASNTQYFYRVYTYDKAYNYATAATCNGTTTGGCTTPTTQASALSTNTPTIDGFNAAWTAGTGNGTMIVVRPIAQPNTLPTSGTAYTANLAWASATQIDANNRVIFRTNGTSCGPVTGLTAETQYTITAYEYNTTGNCYNTTSPPSVTRYTLSTEPTAQPASGFSSSTCNATSIDLTVPAISAGADGYLIIRKVGSAPTGLPTDGTAYAVNDVIGDATVAAIATAAGTITISGLSSSNMYYFQLVPYNANSSAAAQTYNYLTSGTLLQTNISTTATNTSSASTVETDASYSYTQNIPYANYQSTPVPALSSNSVGVHNIIIKDGGATTDADALPTTLTAISYTYTGAANTVRAAALFTTTGSKVADATTIGANSIVFTGLSGSNVTTNDNNSGGAKQLILRVTFNTTVTDNDKLVFTVSAVTGGAICNYSQFALANGGGAFSDNIGINENRIEVTADRIVFGTQPASTSVNTNLSAFTVRFQDANGNLDFDFNRTVTLTATDGGVNMSASASYSITAPHTGIVTFSDVQFTSAPQTAITITATTSGLATSNSVKSNAFNITTIVYNHGDFRTKSSGKWSYNASPPVDITQWEKYNSSIPGWEDFSGQPNTSPEYTAYITKNTEIPTNATAHGRAKIIVMRDPSTNLPATLTFKPSANWTFRNVLVKEGCTIDMQTEGFNVLSGADFELEDGANFLFNFSSTSASTLTSSLWNGVEKFHPNSNFIVKDHEAGSGKYFLPPAAYLTANTYNGITAYFGNLSLESADEVRFTTNNLSGTSNYLTHSDFSITPSKAQSLWYGSGTWVIGRDFKISNPSFALTLTTSANTITFNVKRHLVKDGANAFRLVNNASGNVTINVDSSVFVNSGTMDLNFTTGGTGIINVKDDLTVVSSAYLMSTATTGQLNFNGIYNSLIPATIQTINNASAPSTSSDNQNAGINFSVKGGAYAQLINQNLKLGKSSSLTVETGSTFDFGFDGVNGAGSTALNLTGYGITGTGFTSQSQAYLKISSPSGIVTTSGSVGNIQTNTAPTINTLETFHYIGKENQHTGTCIGTASNGRAVIVDLIDNNTSLTPDVSFGVTATSYSYINSNNGGILDIRKGKFIETTGEYVFGSDGALKMEPGTLYKIVKGYSNPLAAGPEPASPNNFIPRMNGTYTLNGGTIELGGNSAGNYFQTLRGGKTYENIKYSGSNTYVYPTNSSYTYKNLTSNVTINDSLIISENAVLDCIDRSGTAASFEGDGGLVMDGGRMRIKNSSTTQPELKGDNVPYLLTGGTVEFYGTSATQQQQIRGNFRTILSPLKINYYNIDINADAANYSTSNAGNVDLNSSFTLSGNMNVNTPAVLRMDKEESIDGSGTFNVNDGAGLMYGGCVGTPSSAVEGLQASNTPGDVTNSGNIRTDNRSFSSLASYGFISAGDMPSGDGIPSSVAGLYVYKTNSADVVTLSKSVKDNGNLGLHNGKILSSASNKLTLETTASIVNTPTNAGGETNMGHENSYVIGPLGYNSASTSPIIFPIGSTEKYGPIALTPKGATQTYTCDYTSTGYGNYAIDGTDTPPLDHVSKVEWWNVSSTETGANDDAKVKLYWRAHSKVSPTNTDWSNLRVAHFDGTDWNTEGTVATTIHPTPTTAWGWVQSDNYVPNFSPITIGTITANNPLPVELTSFTGQCTDGEVLLKWTTASEFNSKEFLLQRSENGKTYSTIATLPSAGFSNMPKYYSFTDINAKGSDYYRLVEIAVDGKETIHPFIYVTCEATNHIQVYYSTPKIWSDVTATHDKQLVFNIFEVSGKLLHTEIKNISKGYNHFELNNKEHLAKGVYVIQVIDSGSLSTYKVMVE